MRQLHFLESLIQDIENRPGRKPLTLFSAQVDRLQNTTAAYY
jgi:hypothetical protein